MAPPAELETAAGGKLAKRKARKAEVIPSGAWGPGLGPGPGMARARGPGPGPGIPPAYWQLNSSTPLAGYGPGEGGKNWQKSPPLLGRGEIGYDQCVGVSPPGRG